MEKKKVLIITYYWPPSGGSGVQRWLKMSKYLSDFGWEPIIYTAEEGESPAIDESLFSDVRNNQIVLKKKIWEPYKLYKKFTGKKKDERMGAGFLQEKNRKSGITEKIAVWIRGNFFIPDARKFWIKPSVKYLSSYLKENKVDAIISTGPPHSTHLIAMGVSKKLKLPWIADFRDPWTEIDFYNQLKLSNKADKKHKRLERKVLETANLTVTVSKQWAQDLKRLGAPRVEVVTNGFDPDDFPEKSHVLTKEFSITHIGSMNKDRNPSVLWEAISELCQELDGFKQNLKLQFIGKTDYSVFESIEGIGLMSHVRNVDYMNHHDVIEEMAQSQLLLLPINNTPNVSGIIPGKLFEYLAVKRPILAIGPSSAASGEIIIECNAGSITDFNQKEELKANIRSFYDSYLAGTLNVNSESIEPYSRKKLAEKYAELLDHLN